MTYFLVSCAVLVLLSAVFLLRPGRRSQLRAESAANLDWYQLRLRELDSEGQELLVEDVQLRLLEDLPAESEAIEQSPAASLDDAGARRFNGLWLLVPVVALATGLYWHLGAAPDVQISRQLTALDETASPEQIQDLFAAIARRAGERPGNLSYISMLGRFHMDNEDYSAAAAAYRELAKQVPDDAQALALAAQAIYLAAGRELSSEVQALADRALSIDPMERTALGLLGMAAFRAQQYASAIDYWQRLQAMEAPGSPSAQILADVIGAARTRLGGDPSLDGSPTVAAAPVSGITVQVVAPEGEALRGDETVFVLARRVDASSRMPIAVQRFLASDLPLTLRLDDSNSMAGQKLSEAGPVQVFVQVSPDGRPGLENASFSGNSEPVTAAAEGAAVSIQLRPFTG